MHPNYIVQEPKLLYIDRNGYVYPDCKTYKTPIIGRICDSDIVEKIGNVIFGGDITIFNMITVEVSSACNANCMYCFQNDGKREEKYMFFDFLMKVLPQLPTYWLFFSGGEILVQEDAKEFIRKYRQIDKKSWFHLKTNGNGKDDAVEFVCECFDSIMVSFNGFSEMTCRNLMSIDINKTKYFCEKVKEKTNLCVKFLASPACICEISEFVKWAIDMNAKCIAFQTVYNYSFDSNGKSNREKHVFDTLNDDYWMEVFSREGNELESVINEKKGLLNNTTRYLCSDKIILDILALDNNIKDYFRTDGVYYIQ